MYLGLWGYGGCLTASVYWQFELLILKDPKVNSSQKSNELVLAGSGTTFRTLILMLLGNMLKNSDRDSVPIPCPLTDSFESELRTDVSDVRDTFLRVLLKLGSTRTQSVASRPCRARCI